jgi:transposase InsO family protein
MMLHQDGSRHEWLGGRAALDLIVTMDDATSAIYSALLVVEEGTASTFRALEEVFGLHGLPLSLYTDRGSHYFSTPEAGGKVDRACPTQVGRALEHLGVEHIAAYSPQARGRSERVFHTLQDRLTKELALAGITTMEAANMFLRDVYIPAHNARFAVKPEQDGNAFVAITGVNLAEILCVQEERLVGNDNWTSSQLPLESARRRACGRRGQVSDLPTPPTGQQKQKKRTFDVLLKTAKLIRYRHWRLAPVASPIRAEQIRTSTRRGRY